MEWQARLQNGVIHYRLYPMTDVFGLSTSTCLTLSYALHASIRVATVLAVALSRQARCGNHGIGPLCRVQPLLSLALSLFISYASQAFQAFSANLELVKCSNCRCSATTPT